MECAGRAKRRRRFGWPCPARAVGQGSRFWSKAVSPLRSATALQIGPWH